jgi:hypothetical protein
MPDMLKHYHITTSPSPLLPAMLVGSGSVSAEVNLWNPLYAIAPVVLLLISIPLAVFAVITTSIAVSLLACRAAVVYVQLAIAIIGAWLTPSPPKAHYKPRRSSNLSSPEHTSPNRHRNHRRSNASSVSSQDMTVPTLKALRLPKSGTSFVLPMGTSEKTRDFEGVGGWRTPGNDDEEALWMGMNSRLQLPADTTSRRHQRSLTGATSPAQRWSWSPEAFRMSPVQSRARTPTRFAVDDGGGYFPPQPTSNIRSSGSVAGSSWNHKRRRSGGSVSSTASVMTMTGKELG